MSDTTGPARILLIEDNAASRRVVRRSLGQHELLEAEDGEQGLALLAAGPVDLVLLDIGLPGMDGYEVLRRIKAHPDWARTMVILVSARGQTREVVKGFEYLADDYIVKPFRQEELLARVASALRVKRLQDQLRVINQTLESEVQARTQQLLAQQQFALLGRNSAQLAHNLNSPLTALMGYLEMSLMRRDEDHQDLLIKAAEVAGEMQAIIGRMLTGVRTHQQAMGAAEPVNLNQLVEEQIGFWQVDSQFRYQVRVRTELADGLPMVQADHSDLTQILTNLIDNALYAMRGQERAELTLRTETENEQVILEVSDTGQGIPPEDLPRIFEPAFTTKPVGEGTGLGLASCYELAQTYHAGLTVRSVLGQGTTFTLALPAPVCVRLGGE